MSILLLLSLCSVVIPEYEAEMTRRELQHFHGTWVLIQFNNYKLPDVGPSAVRLVIDGEQITEQAGGRRRRGQVKVDPLRHPRTMDVTFGGQTSHGIYDWQGDTWRTLLGEANLPRPREFPAEPPAGGGYHLEIWKLVR